MIRMIPFQARMSASRDAVQPHAQTAHWELSPSLNAWKRNELRLPTGRIAERVAGSRFFSVFPILSSALAQGLGGRPNIVRVRERE
jgi:hypothetical protein